MSNCEAEYVTATIATQECLWLKRLIQEMVISLNQPIQIKCDNESGIKLVRNPVFHACSKHIIHYYFVREKVFSQDVKLHKTHTNEQVADIFTKTLAKLKFEVFRKALVVIEN